MSTKVVTPTGRSGFAIAVDRGVCWLSRHWLLIFNVPIGLYVGLPWLAPVFMHLGWTTAGSIIYQIYATQCHQLPQRSYFLFGPKLMYALADIQAAWQPTNDAAILRQFIGNPDMGWKVAWSDRMVSMYTIIFIASLLFALVRTRLKPLSLRAFAFLTLPMILDGGTHVISDLAGIGHGFRDSNAWLAILTGHLLPATFYTGDALGSFNAWMRVMTGVLLGIGVIWLAYPHIESAWRETVGDLAPHPYTRRPHMIGIDQHHLAEHFTGVAHAQNSLGTSDER
jgi:uncharacterized membrane protein